MRTNAALLAFLFAAAAGASCLLSFGDVPRGRLRAILERRRQNPRDLAALLDLEEWRERSGPYGEEKLLRLESKQSEPASALVYFVLLPPGEKAAALKGWLIQAAADGAPRAELLRGWKQIAAWSTGDDAFAQSMVEAYTRQIREIDDAPRRSEEELATMSAAARAEYWIARVPEIRGEPESNPTMVWPPVRAGASAPERPWPPFEAYEVGLPAVPFLIEHMDDAGPTRTLRPLYRYAFRDSPSPSLLTVGEVCSDILRAVTGRDFNREAWSAAGGNSSGDATARKLAEAWWAPKSTLSREDQLLALLEDNPARASSELLGEFGNAHLPEIVRAVRAHPDETGCLIDEHWARLGPEHADLFRAMLAAGDTPTHVLAAEALRRKAGDSSAFDDVVARLRGGEKSVPRNSRIDVEEAILVLIRVDRKIAVELTMEMLRQQPGELNPEWLSAICYVPEPSILAAAEPWLDVPARADGWVGEGAGPRYCDYAVGGIGFMIDWPGIYPDKGSNEGSDQLVASLRGWLRGIREHLDWPSLRAQWLLHELK